MKLSTKKKNKHIHNNPKMDCPACIELIKLPMPKFRVMPLPQTRKEKAMQKTMQKTMQRLIDSIWADAKGKKILRTPFGTLIWTSKR